MSVNAEFTKALPVTGVDTHVTVSLPGRLTMAVELDNWKLMLAWKPASSGPAGLTTLYHYHVRPFTALQSISSDLPANPNPGESKIVHASGVNPVSVNDSLFFTATCSIVVLVFKYLNGNEYWLESTSDRR